jgi:hypothetical protein
MRTSEHLAEAAGHLAQLLREGQHDLRTPADLALAVQARDQLATGLARGLQLTLTHLDAAGGHLDAVEATRPLAQALTELPRHHQPNAAESDHAASTSRACQAWIRAAEAVTAAADQATRADPGSPTIWRAAAIDLAALSGSLASLDSDLTDAAHTIAPTPDAPTEAARQAFEELRHSARAAVTALDLAGLPDQYHLTPPVLGVAPVTAAHHVPIAVRRAVVLLARSPSLTAAQHAAVAVETARLVHRLRSERDAAAGEDLDPALRRFAQAHLGVAHVWNAAAHLNCTGAGSWEPAAQLQAVSNYLARPEHPRLSAQQLQGTFRLLPAVTASVTTGLDEALVKEDWTAAYRDGDGRLVQATIWPDYEPESRELTASLWDLTPAAVHLAGHAAHEAWHDRDIPANGYRLGDAAQDPDPGAPHAIAELNRIHTALNAAAATGRGILNAFGPPAPDGAARRPSGAAPARAALSTPTSTGPDTPPARQAAPQPISLRGPHDVADAVRRLTRLLTAADRMTTDDWKAIARTAADTALDAGHALYLAARPAPAQALLDHARLLTDAAQAMPPTSPMSHPNQQPLVQAGRIRRLLADHRKRRAPLPRETALNIAREIPALAQALAQTADRFATGRPPRSRPGSLGTRWAHSATLAADRMARACALTPRITATLAAAASPPSTLSARVQGGRR